MDSQPLTRDRIFISYRRDDARGASGRLYDWLRIAFGRDRVFRDVAAIGVGKWRDKIDAALGRSAVCVAVIGPRWANADNLPRLHAPDDMVRHELIKALADTAVTLVPTLVEGLQVKQVPVENLPSELRPLFNVWNALPLSEEGWEDDTRRLIAAIEQAAALPVGPDVDTLLQSVGAAQQRVQELEYTRQLQADQIIALRGTVENLTTKLADAAPQDRSGLAAAFAALARGDSLAAENAFEREYLAQQQAAHQARQGMAQSALNVANLALLHDLNKALLFYRKALQSDPENADAARLLGSALILHGNLADAEKAFSQSLEIAQSKNDIWGEMAAQVGLGDVALKLRNLASAHAAYTAARNIAEQLAARDPANTDWQRDLSVSHERIGDVLVSQGDGAGALTAYRASMGICEQLAERDPANTQWQRDLSVSHNRIGNVLVAQGDGAGALTAYRAGMGIAEQLAARDPANTEWQRDLSISHNKIGDVLVAQGDGAGAFTAYRASMGIREQLVVRDPANTEWQRDLSVSHNKIGDVLVSQGDGAGALKAYRAGMGICEQLAGRDPANTEWQRDLSISHNKIGDVLVAQGDGAGALTAYRAGMGICEQLAARDPANTQWQRDLSVSHNKIGDVLEAQGDGAGALTAYRAGMGIREQLVVRDPANTEWQRDLSVSHDRIGDVLVSQGDGAGALTAYRAGMGICEQLAAHDPANTQWQTDVAVSCAKLGILQNLQTLSERRAFLARGRQILADLDSAGRLLPSQNWIPWFDQQLQALASEPPEKTASA